jgi:anti-sigma regulatory factor (Ser/Thr protein kinase)
MPELSDQSRPAALRLSLACDLAKVRPAVQEVKQFLAEQRCPEGVVTDCELALVEACTNAIQGVVRPAIAEPVLVEVLCDAHWVELRVTDSTPGFDWPDHAALPEPERESGRGLFLIQSLMSYSNYYRSLRGNLLIMRKKRS